MERIKTIEQLKLQKELLQLQRMIAELRMKKEIHVMRRQMGVRNLVFPAVKHLVTKGIKTKVGKQVLFSAAALVAKKLFRKKAR